MKTTLWLRLLFLVCSAVFLVTVFLQDRTDIVFIFVVTSYSRLAIVILFWVLAIRTLPTIAFAILRGRKDSITFRTLLSIHLNRIASNFLPSSVWQIFARVYDMSNIDISKIGISIDVLYEGSHLHHYHRNNCIPSRNLLI
jgi:hypothetical protein